MVENGDFWPIIFKKKPYVHLAGLFFFRKNSPHKKDAG
jgi:hypothetical protein